MTMHFHRIISTPLDVITQGHVGPGSFFEVKNLALSPPMFLF